MTWDQITIWDKEGKAYSGIKAREFFESNCDTDDITTYPGKGTIAVKITRGKRSGKKSVSADYVRATLWSKLKDKVGSVQIDQSYFSAPKVKRVIPRKKKKNPINKVAKYTLTLELGDIDALFDPIASDAEPWKQKGVQQRLQVLGYLYTPLEHPGNKAPDFNHAKACWYTYMHIHKVEDYPSTITRLIEEVKGNLIALEFPKSGQTLGESVLPESRTFAAIRFPGGYCTTKSAGTKLRAGDHFFNDSNLSAVDTKYDFEIGDPRDLIEKIVFEENPLLGKIPLIAKVTKQFPGEEAEVIPDVPVLFQLMMPDEVDTDSPFSAPELPHKVMNYSLDGSFWKSEAYPQTNDHKDLNPLEWKAVHRITKASYDLSQPPPPSVDAATKAKEWIDAWASTPVKEVGWNNVKDWWGDQTQIPYTRLALDVEETKKYATEMIVPPPITNFQGYKEEEFKLLVRVLKAAKAQNSNKMQAKRLAKGWLTEWAEAGDGPVEWSHVENWWGNEHATPYAKLPVSESPRSEVPATNAGNQFDSIWGYLSPPRKPGKVSANEWAAIKKIAAAAKAQKDDEQEAITLAESWIDVWNAAPAIGWESIEDWWGEESDEPYPILRSDMLETAKERVDFILADRVAGTTRQNEISDIGQKKFIADLMTEIISNRDDLDPQKANAPTEYGGKAGADIEEVLEKPTAQREGFHTKRPIQTTDYGTLKLATVPSDRVAHPYAMECKTNEKGIAGVIFQPSHCGGDKYKLQAYIDPDWLTGRSPSTVHHKSFVETGTMVVWRSIRIHRYLQLKTTPMELSDDLITLLREGNCNIDDETTFGKMFLNTPLTDLLVIPGEGDTDGPYPPLTIDYLSKADKSTTQMLKYRPITVNGTHFETHFNRGYCELIADGEGVEAVSEIELRDARREGINAFENSGKLDKRIKWDKFLLYDPKSPFLVNIRSPKQYNELLTRDEKVAYKPLDFDDGGKIEEGLRNLLEAMLEYLADGGVVPGITVFQIPRGDTWDPFASSGLCASPITSGYGTASRAAFLSWTDGKYKDSFIYPATSNCLHEVGHVLGLCHQYYGGGSIDAAHQTAIRTKFKKPDDDQCVCVMSYNGCYGDYCGKCLLSLRGWKTHNRGDT